MEHVLLYQRMKGMGIMLSSFTSREFGYGFVLTKDELKRINEEMRGEDKFLFRS